jgi:5-methylthioribose kinase
MATLVPLSFTYVVKICLFWMSFLHQNFFIEENSRNWEMQLLEVSLVESTAWRSSQGDQTSLWEKTQSVAQHIFAYIKHNSISV